VNRPEKGKNPTQKKLFPRKRRGKNNSEENPLRGSNIVKTEAPRTKRKTVCKIGREIFVGQKQTTNGGRNAGRGESSLLEKEKGENEKVGDEGGIPCETVCRQKTEHVVKSLCGGRFGE